MLGTNKQTNKSTKKINKSTNKQILCNALRIRVADSRTKDRSTAGAGATGVLGCEADRV